MREEDTGGNFSEEKFPPDPFQKTFGQGVRMQLPDCFTVVGVWCGI